jgi:hypothetical protein
MYFRIDLAFEPVFGNIQIIIHLQAQPELRRILEIAGQPERGVSGNTPFAKHDFVYPARRDMERDGKFVLRQTHGRDEFVLQNLSGMYGRKFFCAHILSFVIIDYFHFESIIALPLETYSPLIVYPYRILSFPVTFHLFKTVRGRYP